MKLTFALLLISTTLGVGSASVAASRGLTFMSDAHLTSRPAKAATMTLIDDDEKEGKAGWFWSLSDNDDDCQGDDDEGACAAGDAGNPAKAGTVAPPKNGLFTDGTAPVVKSN